MTIKGINKKAFRERLVKASSNCVAQHTGWPCGTCCIGNQQTWHAVLAYRGDSESFKTKAGYRMPSGIHFKDDGTFSHHSYVEVSRAEVEQRIRQLWEVIK